jgi:protein-tyrosine kinase
LGKIYDALEKFQEDKKEPTPVEGPKTFASKMNETKDNSLDEVEELLESNNIDENMIVFYRPQSFEAEQFKILRTKLLFPPSGKPARSIMVTSSLPGEGKSFVTANLAISIAQNIHEHVLIIDCDMRIPSIHKRFGFGKVPGLSEYLSSRAPIESLMLKTKIDKLSLLPAGELPDNPSELLSSQAMFDFLKEVKDRYSDRYIIIDSPPPKLAAETYAISRQVEGILLVVKHGGTPRKMVAELVKTLGKEKILGVVFNNLDMRLSNYFSYKKYGKNGRYYTKYHK